MSGAIMPAPLAMPLMVTVALPMRAVRGRHLGKGVGGHDRLGRGEEVARLARARRGRPSPARTCWHRAARRSRRWRRGKSRAGLQPAALAAISAVSLVAARPLLPVKALALPELTTSARALPRFEMRPAPFDRRRRAFRSGEHAGRRGAGVEQRQQHVGAPGIADAGLGGGQPHAGDRRHVRHVLRGEGGDGGGHGCSRHPGRRACTRRSR